MFCYSESVTEKAQRNVMDVGKVIKMSKRM